MEITNANRFPNAVESRPTYASDDECARLLANVLVNVPAELNGRASPFPLLDALTERDGRSGTDLARQIVFVAAAAHDTADERRTAEYLLRNRRIVADGGRSVLSLLLAARCAAEMDVRRVLLREVPTSHGALAARASDQPVTRDEDPSVGEMVLVKLCTAVGCHSVTARTADRLLDAVSITLELAERHAMNGGREPSLLGMRADARRGARLVTRLRDEFGNAAAARGVARLLVGADGTPIETALLWWSARPDLRASDVPANVRGRWIRYLRIAEAAFAAARPVCPRGYPQKCAC
jgi:hypothetical protein